MTDLAATLSSLATAPKYRGPVCSITETLEKLAVTDQAARDALLAALDDPAVDAGGLAAALIEHGHDVGAHSIRRHRRRSTGSGCKCPR